MLYPFHSIFLGYNNIRREIHIMKLFIVQFPPVTSSLLGQNIAVSTMFLNTTSVCSRDMSDEFHAHMKLMVKL